MEGVPDAIDTFLGAETFVLGADQRGKYMSIVVVGDDEDFTTERLERFLRVIDFGLSKAPTADIEVVFIEYGVQDSVRESIQVSPMLSKKVRFLRISESEIDASREDPREEEQSFMESVGRNVGIRRSFGCFVLTTTIDTILPSSFFELVARRDFHEGIVYQAKQYDIDIPNSGFYDMLDAMHEKWRFRELNATKHCLKFKRRLLLADSIEKFVENFEDCGIENFIMMSRKMWHAIGGFDEMPDFAEQFQVFLGKMMRMVPGYVRMFIQPIILHNNGGVSRTYPPREADIDKVMEDYACKGETDQISVEEHRDWGLRGLFIEEFTVE
jgi:hypothetical protein